MTGFVKTDVRVEAEANSLPNLDEMTPEELDETARVFERLTAYTKLKAWAMRERALGDVQSALAYERQCDRHYDALPDWAKW